MYPREAEQERISWMNVHHKESRIKSLGTYFDWQVELSEYCSFQTIKSSYDYVTGLHDHFFSIKSVESTLRQDIQSRTSIHQYVRQCSAIAFNGDVQGFVVFPSGRS